MGDRTPNLTDVLAPLEIERFGEVVDGLFEVHVRIESVSGDKSSATSACVSTVSRDSRIDHRCSRRGASLTEAWSGRLRYPSSSSAPHPVQEITDTQARFSGKR